MLDWVPTDIQRQYGERASSALNGDLLVLPTSGTSELVAAFERHGYICVRDDSLVRRASGYREHASPRPESQR
jgi:hypothetical protein